MYCNDTSNRRAHAQQTTHIYTLLHPIFAHHNGYKMNSIEEEKNCWQSFMMRMRMVCAKCLTRVSSFIFIQLNRASQFIEVKHERLACVIFWHKTKRTSTCFFCIQLRDRRSESVELYAGSSDRSHSELLD